MTPLALYVYLFSTPIVFLMIYLTKGGLAFNFTTVKVLFSMPLISWAGGFIIAHLCRIEIADDGIRGSDVFGIRRFVPWEAITTVKKWWYTGLPAFRVKTHPGLPTLYYPDFFENREDLLSVISESAPWGNSLLEYFKAKSAE